MSYIHVLRSEGDSLICGHCQLDGSDSDVESWEAFLNGRWVLDPPDRIGLFPALIVGTRTAREDGSLQYLQARETVNQKGRFIWENAQIRNRVKARWSVPIPSDILVEQCLEEGIS